MSSNDVMIFNGWFVQGWSAGRGMVVVRSSYVAFLPTEKMTHLGAELVKGAAFAGAGIVVTGSDARLPVDQWLEHLRKQSPDVFDERLLQVVKKIGGVMWRPADAKVNYKRILFRRKKGLWFVAGKSSMRIAKPLLDQESLVRAQELLKNWQS
jgi:hypothetical protein